LRRKAIIQGASFLSYLNCQMRSTRMNHCRRSVSGRALVRALNRL